MPILPICASQDTLVPIYELRLAAFLSFMLGITAGVVILGIILKT